MQRKDLTLQRDLSTARSRQKRRPQLRKMMTSREKIVELSFRPQGNRRFRRYSGKGFRSTYPRLCPALIHEPEPLPLAFLLRTMKDANMSHVLLVLPPWPFVLLVLVISCRICGYHYLAMRIDANGLAEVRSPLTKCLVFVVPSSQALPGRSAPDDCGPGSCSCGGSCSTS